MINCVVPVSGGKDSQASLELAIKEFGPQHVCGLFCDTQFEHPLTYEHVAWMSKFYGVQIRTVSGGSVLEKTAKYGRFPTWAARFCTDELKIRETRIFLKGLADSQGCGFEVWYGMRLSESAARRKRYAGKAATELYPPHLILPNKYPQYLEKMGVMFRLPILEWTEAQVLGLLDGRQNPLYSQGFDRVGCFPCLAAGDQYKEKAFKHDEFGRAQLIATNQVGDAIGKSVWTSKSGQLRNEGPGCKLCEI